MFLLSQREFEVLRSHIGASNSRGGRRYPPYAFTEQGVAMLSSALNSPRAIQVNIAIIRTFVQLREILSTHKDLARKLDALEKKYDKQFQVIFEAIRQLMIPPPADLKKRQIGFGPWKEKKKRKTTARRKKT